jgi:hypothetical protein
MSTDIQPGDLVQVVRPLACCGDVSPVGHVFVAEALLPAWEGMQLRCPDCGASITISSKEHVYRSEWGLLMPKYALKKIDPPAEGDTLPVRRELELV